MPTFFLKMPKQALVKRFLYTDFFNYLGFFAANAFIYPGHFRR